MLRRIDRILLRVPNVESAARFYRDVMGIKLIRHDRRLALLELDDQQTQLVLHADPDLPGEGIYYLVDDVRDLHRRREQLQLHFVQPPAPGARGWRAAIKDPFGNVLLIVDRTGQSSAIEDAKPPGALFPGVEPQLPVRRDLLISVYEKIGRTADDLPYTPEFQRLYDLYIAAHRDPRPTRGEVWRQLLNLRKGGKLPKLGAARSLAPEISPDHKTLLRTLIGKDMGKRDRLPYTDRFDTIVDEFNKSQPRPLSPHLVWRLVATLAK